MKTILLRKPLVEEKMDWSWVQLICCLNKTKSYKEVGNVSPQIRLWGTQINPIIIVIILKQPNFDGAYMVSSLGFAVQVRLDTEQWAMPPPSG